MSDRPDINETLVMKGSDAVRARSDWAKPFRPPIFIVSSAEDRSTLTQWGLSASTNHNALEFSDEDVVVMVGNNGAGRAREHAFAASLQGLAASVRLLDWTKVWDDGNVASWRDKAGGTADQLSKIIDRLPAWKPQAKHDGNAAEPPPPSSPADYGLDAQQEQPPETNSSNTPPAILSKSDFIKGFVPPDYLIDGILQRRFIYSLTGQVSHAKTAVALRIAELVGSRDQDANLGGHRVEKGQVVYFVGENPDDVRMRVIGADAKRADDPASDQISFIPGVFNIGQMFATLEIDLRKRGEFSLIIVDTSAAYFLGNEELSNTQMGEHARMLRRLTTLPGGPCVLVLCHPIKHTTDPAQLLPRGGGAYLAEMDGNLTLWKHDEALTELSYNKMRGAGFEPITFRLEKITTTKLVDTNGRLIPTVRAMPISEGEEESQARRTREDEDRLLAAMLSKADHQSIADLARACGWVTQNKEPQKSKVHRILERLEKKPKLVKKERGGEWVLTEDGKITARTAALRFARERQRQGDG
jgi:AAA domain